jgi:phage/plasmid-like protein (TIGR03299 family)
MSHDIWERDNLILFKQPAWHGLGTVVQQAPSPREALYAAHLDWEIEQITLHGTRRVMALGDGGVSVENHTFQVPDHIAHVRSDTGEVLGVVGKNFGVVQNADLVDLIYQAADTEGVTVESAGSLRNGREVFFLCHLNTFNIPGTKDRVHQYALVVNAHDGSRRLLVLPTDIRVVCANTKTWALQQALRQGLGIALRHSSGIMGRVPEVVEALRGVKRQAEVTQTKSRALAERKMTTDEVQTFFMGVYVSQYGAPPTGPVSTLTRGEKAKRTRAIDMVSDWSQALLADQRALGVDANAWLAANAVTQWADHKRSSRGDRAHSNLIGSAAQVKDAAFAQALVLTE